MDEDNGNNPPRRIYKRHLYPEFADEPLSWYAKRQLQGGLDEEMNQQPANVEVPLNAPRNCEAPDLNAQDEDSRGSSHFADNNEEVSNTSSADEIESEDSDDGAEEMPEMIHEKLLKYVQNVTTNNLSCRVSVADILVMVITLAVTHNLSLSATCCVFQMLNGIFSTNIFPESKYILKNLLNPNVGMTMHFCCEFCGHYLGKKDDGIERIECSNCKMENVVTGYKYEYTFITLDIRYQLREMLANPSLSFDFAQGDRLHFTDICDGETYKSMIPPNDPTTRYLSWSFNSDSAPLSRDSQTCIVPILLTINELNFEQRSENVVLAGLWFGKMKPRMDIFLTPFVTEMNVLRTQGFNAIRENENISVKLVPTCCVVDTVARSPMQGLNAVGGYYCCSWCFKRGEAVEGTVKYTNERNDLDPRTEENFKAAANEYAESDQRTHVQGVKGASPLNLLFFFLMVWGFVPDYMHATLQGVVKRFLLLWTSLFGSVFYIGSPTIIQELDNRLKRIRPPSILRRSPVLMSMRKHMNKARELENWFLFYSVPVLNGILPQEHLNHWKLLVNSMYLLLQDEVSQDDVNRAELMLIEFVYKAEILYGKREMTYNMHQHLHFVESVRRWGPIWAHTAFPFESQIGVLKKVVKSAKGIPHMIIRNIELIRSRDIILRTVECSEVATDFCSKVQGSCTYKVRNSVDNEKLFGQLGRFEGNLMNLPADHTYTEYKKLVKNSVVYECKRENDLRKFDNSYVEMRDGRFAQILKILLDNDSGRSYVHLEILTTEQVDGLTHMHKVLGRTVSISYCVFNEIKNIAVHIHCTEHEEFICSVPHKHFAMNL